MIPLVDMNAVVAALGSRLAARIDGVMAGGRFILGPEVAEFEATLAAWAGTPTAVGVASGTDALVLALKLRGVGPGDAVFVPSFTFAATAEAVALVGAMPVFVEVRADTFNLDPERLAAA
ncbi:MAG: aminotransferase class I/II-fold pyridoxal phosphate-dependent enzyme, partial [Rhodovibrionaceae bacterium]|nr:aminotransferase class I/II-fold pyridoxal phosphate-dependent enzyme [Rhodovibrionaceae bacterium]